MATSSTKLPLTFRALPAGWLALARSPARRHRLRKAVDLAAAGRRVRRSQPFPHLLLLAGDQPGPFIASAVWLDAHPEIRSQSEAAAGSQWQAVLIQAQETWDFGGRIFSSLFTHLSSRSNFTHSRTQFPYSDWGWGGGGSTFSCSPLHPGNSEARGPESTAEAPPGEEQPRFMMSPVPLPRFL